LCHLCSRLIQATMLWLMLRTAVSELARFPQISDEDFVKQ
jgi:hypothetical protein